MLKMTKFISTFFLIMLSCNFTPVKSSNLNNINNNLSKKQTKEAMKKLEAINNGISTSNININTNNNNINQTSIRMNKFKKEQNKESGSNSESSSRNKPRERSRNNSFDVEIQDKVRTKIFFGGGNLSYELSFMKKHSKDAKKMIVTTYDSETQMNEKYKGTVDKNKKELESKGVIVAHNIDATKLKDLEDQLKKQTIDCSFSPRDLYFSHPHTGDQQGGTAKLVDNFFRSANEIQEPGYLIHMPRVKGGVDTKFSDLKVRKKFMQEYKTIKTDYLSRQSTSTKLDLKKINKDMSSRAVTQINKEQNKEQNKDEKNFASKQSKDEKNFASKQNKFRKDGSVYQGLYDFRGSKGIKHYKLIRKIKFDSERYGGYEHKQTKKDQPANGVEDLGSTEYVFERRTNPEENFYDVEDSYLSGDSRNSSISYKNSKGDEESGND